MGKARIITIWCDEDESIPSIEDLTLEELSELGMVVYDEIVEYSEEDDGSLFED